MESVRGRWNNFDLLRLVAATQVVVFHALEHLRIELHGASFMLAQVASAVPGVPVFFVISGYLISLSFERQGRDVRRYARNRCLRIFPALWVAFFIGAASVALFSVAFRHVPAPRLVTWTALQLTLGQAYNPDFLRHYGTGVFNGSLWTIPIELEFYALLPLLYVLLRIGRSRLGDAALLGLFAFATLFATLLEGGAAKHAPSFIAKATHYSIVPYLYMFLAGVLLQRHAERLRPIIEGRAALWLCAYAVSALVARHFGLTVGSNEPFFGLSFVLAFTVVACAFSAPWLARRILHGNDLSYGIYVYHMLLINVLVERGSLGNGRLVLPVVLATYAIAFVSWMLVEKPALALKSTRRSPAAARAPA